MFLRFEMHNTFSLLKACYPLIDRNNAQRPKLYEYNMRFAALKQLTHSYFFKQMTKLIEVIASHIESLGSCAERHISFIYQWHLLISSPSQHSVIKGINLL